MLILQLFFAQAPRGTTENDIKALFSNFGHVEAVKCSRYAYSATTSCPPASRAAATSPSDVRSFHRAPCGDTKGSGLVKMASVQEAAAAVAALDGRFKWGCNSEPMVSL